MDLVTKNGFEKFLKGKEQITWGSSAEIFAHGENILRLSSDMGSHNMLVMTQNLGLAVPKMFKNFGYSLPIESTDIEEDAVWLAEFERLEELDDKLEKQVIEEVESLLELSPEKDAIVSNTIIEEFMVNIRNSDQHFYRHIDLNTLFHICNIALPWFSELDLDFSNFMYSRNQDRVVFMDPVNGGFDKIVLQYLDAIDENSTFV